MATGNWESLVGITREAVQLAEEEHDRMPLACLDCGEPLRTGPRGELFCPSDGTVWAQGNLRIGHVGIN